MVVEMERRAEERQRIREERRLWHKQKEEERLAEEQAAEDARRLEEEEEKRRQVQEYKERKRVEQRKHAERLVAVAQQRQRTRQAQEFWRRNRLIDVWCGLRQAVIEADEMQLAAWCCYRDALQRASFSLWKHETIRSRCAQDACCLARARQAEWYFRRHTFRTLIRYLRLLCQRREWQVVTARQSLLQACARSRVGRWKEVATRSVFEKKCRAVRQYGKGLLRCAIKWWQAGVRQTRLDAELLSHKQELHKKVSGWLKEIDVSAPRLRADLAPSL